MAAQAGKDVLIEINTTGVIYVPLGGLQSRSISLNTETIDITNSDSVGLWRELLGTAGVRSLDVSGAGVFLDDAAMGKVVNNMLGTVATHLLKVTIAGLGTFSGNFAFESLTFSGQHNSEVKFDVTIKSGGALAFAAL